MVLQALDAFSRHRLDIVCLEEVLLPYLEHLAIPAYNITIDRSELKLRSLH